MASLPLTALTRLVLALLLAVGSVITTEPAAAVRTATSAPEEDQDDDRDTELAAPTAPRRAARTATPPEPFARTPHLSGADGRSRIPSVIGSRPATLDPLGARLRC